LRLAAPSAMKGTEAGLPPVAVWSAPLRVDADRADQAGHPRGPGDGRAGNPAAVVAVVSGQAVPPVRVAGAVASGRQAARCVARRPEAACAPEAAASVLLAAAERPAAAAAGSDVTQPAAAPSVREEVEGEQPADVERAAPGGLPPVAGPQVALPVVVRAAVRASQLEAVPSGPAPAWRAVCSDPARARAPEQAGAGQTADLPSRCETRSEQARPHRPEEWL
jgi:hypothetical protein